MAYARQIVAENRAAGDEGSIEAALRAHAPVLGRVCMALLGGDPEAAEKALERVAREAGAAILPPTPLAAKTWLLGLARAACATQLSKMPMRTGHGNRDAPSTARLGVVEEAASARASLGELKPTEREAVVLHVVGGLDATEVARACGIDEITARTRIARGVSQLLEGASK